MSGRPIKRTLRASMPLRQHLSSFVGSGEAGRHPGRLTGGAPRRAPAADGDAVAVEDQRAVRVAACPPSAYRKT